MSNKKIIAVIGILQLILGLALIYQTGFASGGVLNPAPNSTFYGGQEIYSVDFSPDSASITQSQSVDFTIGNAQSIYGDTPMLYTQWMVDGNTVANGQDQVITVYGSDYGIGYHSVEADIQCYGNYNDFIICSGSFTVTGSTPPPTQPPVWYTLTVQDYQMTPSGFGSYNNIVMSSDGTLYHEATSYSVRSGDTVQVWGTPAPGYVQQGIYLDGTFHSGIGTLTFTMNGQHTVKIAFQASQTTTQGQTSQQTTHTTVITTTSGTQVITTSQTTTQTLAPTATQTPNPFNPNPNYPTPQPHVSSLGMSTLVLFAVGVSLVG